MGTSAVFQYLAEYTQQNYTIYCLLGENIPCEYCTHPFLPWVSLRQCNSKNNCKGGVAGLCPIRSPYVLLGGTPESHSPAHSPEGRRVTVAVMVPNYSLTIHPLGTQDLRWSDSAPGADLKGFWTTFILGPLVDKSFLNLTLWGSNVSGAQTSQHKTAWDLFILFLPGNCQCLRPNAQHKAQSI